MGKVDSAKRPSDFSIPSEENSKNEETSTPRRGVKRIRSSSCRKSQTKRNRKRRLKCSKSFDITPEQKSEQLKKRTQIIKEIHLTEQSYIFTLHELIEAIVIPLEKQYQTNKTPLITKSNYETIFGNIRSIFRCNSKIEANMAKRLQSPLYEIHDPWCDILLEALQDPEIKLQETYQAYVNGYHQASKILKQEMKNNETSQWIQEQLIGKSHSTLASYLITPIQRLPRYILFLKDLKKITLESHSDYHIISQALDAFLELTSEIDAGRAVYESSLEKEALLQLFPATEQTFLPELRNPDELLYAKGEMNVLLPGKSKEEIYYIIYLCKVEILSSSISFHPERKTIRKNHEVVGVIQICKIDRIETFPYLGHVEYLFSPTGKANDEKWAFWAATFQEAWEGTANLSSLARRAWVTKSHISRVILRDDVWNFLSKQPVVTLQPGELLLAQGETLSTLYYLQEGKLNVSKQKGEKEHVISSVSQGNFVGDMGFIQQLENSTYAASATLSAKTKCTVVKITYDILERAVNTNPELAWRFFFLVSAEISYKIIRLDAFRSLGKESLGDLKRVSKKLETLCFIGPILQDKKNTRQKTVKQAVIVEYKCHFKLGRLNNYLHGTLSISQNGFRVYRKVFGKKTKVFVPYASIVSSTCPNKQKISLVYNHTDSNKEKEMYIGLKFKKEVFEDATASLMKFFQNTVVLNTSNELDVSGEKVEVDSIFNEEKVVSKGTHVLTQGLLNNVVYNIISGSCDVLINNRIVGTLSDGDIFGELGFLLCTVPSASIVVTSKTVILAQCTWEALNQLCIRNPPQAAGFYKNLVRSLASQFLQAESIVISKSSS